MTRISFPGSQRWSRTGSARLVTAPLLATLLAGCSVPAKPLLVATGTIRAQVHTVCITQLTVEIGVVHADQRLPVFLEQMRAALSEAGFEVPEIEKIEAVKERVFASAGRIWDPDTGKRDDPAFARAKTAYFQAARNELGCDAMATGRVVVVQSQIYGGVAKWDGVRMPVPGTDFGTTGWVAALSFWLTLDDMQQREIYFNTGGIQLLVGFAQDSIFSDPKAVPTENENILAYDANNRRAIRTALDSFLTPRAKRASF